MANIRPLLLLAVLFTASAEAGPDYSRCQPNDFKKVSHRLSPEGKLLTPKGDNVIVRESYRPPIDIVSWARSIGAPWILWTLNRDDAGRVTSIQEEYADGTGMNLPGEERLIFAYDEDGACYLKEVEKVDAARVVKRIYSKAACDAKYGPRVEDKEAGTDCYKYAKIYSGTEPSDWEPSEAWRLAREAEIAYGAKDYDRAIDIYQRSLKLEPHRCEAISIVGSLYLKNGDDKKARELYRSAKACGARNDEMMMLSREFR